MSLLNRKKKQETAFSAPPSAAPDETKEPYVPASDVSSSDLSGSSSDSGESAVYGETYSEPAAVSEPLAVESSPQDDSGAVFSADDTSDELPAVAAESYSAVSDTAGDDISFSVSTFETPVAPRVSNEPKKSLGFEDTVKLQDARKAFGNRKLIDEPIKEGEAVPKLNKRKGYVEVASGTAHISGGLPPLQDDEIYAILNVKDMQRLKSRRYRGLGVLATFCLVIIAAFCIWNYANSFADPLVGVWKGDVDSAYIPVEQIQQMNEALLTSTWEFSSSGSMYLRIVVKETPISISGTYEKKKDDSGEPYLSMTLTNPMDSSDYTLEMYYTVTGDILEFNDMQDMGMTIDLTKE